MPQFFLLFCAILQSWRPKGEAMAQWPTPKYAPGSYLPIGHFTKKIAVCSAICQFLRYIFAVSIYLLVYQNTFWVYQFTLLGR